MYHTFRWPQPDADACYQARTWEMSPDEVRLFAFAIGLDQEGCEAWLRTGRATHDPGSPTGPGVHPGGD